MSECGLVLERRTEGQLGQVPGGGGDGGEQQEVRVQEHLVLGQRRRPKPKTTLVDFVPS